MHIEMYITLPFHLLHIFLQLSQQLSYPALQLAQFLFHHIVLEVPK